MADRRAAHLTFRKRVFLPLVVVDEFAVTGNDSRITFRERNSGEFLNWKKSEVLLQLTEHS